MSTTFKPHFRRMHSALRARKNVTGVASRNVFAPPMRTTEKRKEFHTRDERCITYVYSVSSSDYTACKAEKFLLFLEIPVSIERIETLPRDEKTWNSTGSGKTISTVYFVT